MELSRKLNITLIGMPGAGKSTTGIVLAKALSFGFVDTDVLIQTRHGKPLQQIMNESSHLRLREIEAAEILSLNLDRHVIATGGSAAYSAKAMAHLLDISIVVFLEVGFEEIVRRIHDFESRGIAKSPEQTFRQLFDERQVLYRKYAQITIDANRLDQEELAMQIAARYWALR